MVTPLSRVQLQHRLRLWVPIYRRSALHNTDSVCPQYARLRSSRMLPRFCGPLTLSLLMFPITRASSKTRWTSAPSSASLCRPTLPSRIPTPTIRVTTPQRSSYRMCGWSSATASRSMARTMRFLRRENMSSLCLISRLSSFLLQRRCVPFHKLLSARLICTGKASCGQEGYNSSPTTPSSCKESTYGRCPPPFNLSSHHSTQ